MWEHHAYLLLGQREWWLEKLKPDLPLDRVYQETETYGIDEARQLKRWQEQTIITETRPPRPSLYSGHPSLAKEGKGGGSRRFLIISFRQITPEAQNALLKTLEEPTLGNHFFLITESAHGLLPTLLSRLQILQLANESGDDALDQWADKFLAAAYEERLALILDYLTHLEALPPSGGSGTSSHAAKAAALRLVNVLESKLHAQLERDPHNQKLISALATLLTMGDYLHDQAALPKLILEHLALVLPRP